MPETHLMWHSVAPRLTEHFTVVATDLRGFGGSGAPPSGAGGAGFLAGGVGRGGVRRPVARRGRVLL